MTLRRRYLWLGFAAVLAVRLGVFPFARNFYGDPAMRLKALTAWLAHPFFLRSFVGARQFGPLHLYLLALGQWLHADLVDGPRWISLLFGVLTALPFFRLTERRFGARAALWSTLCLAVYALHIQTSTTATSEAVFLFFLLTALDALDLAAAGSRPALLLGGFLMACACAVRYDGWLYAPLAVGWLWQGWRRGTVSTASVAAYLAMALAVPALLTLGNWYDLGDPLYIVHYINEDHVRMAHRTAAEMGRGWYALYCLAFWPANLIWELSLPVALGVGFGGWSAVRERKGLDLLLLAAVPALFFSAEGALLLRFHPLARFTLPTAVLLLPYAGHGLERLAALLPRPRLAVFAAAAVVIAVATPVFFAARSIGHTDWIADTLRPISPVSNLPPDLEAAAAWIRAHGEDKRVEVETNWLYEELPIELYGRTPNNALFTPRDGASPSGFWPPDLVVLPREADILRTGQAKLEGATLWKRATRFDAVAQLGTVTIFARD